MANTSAGSYSDCNRKFEYQVFLSFRGPDTRTFVGHLSKALQYRTGFRGFLDNDGLQQGKDIQKKLYEGIDRSEVSVVILSPGYVNSHWCLDELVTIMERQALNVNRVLPVFFNLEPTVVRNQTGVYKDAFLVLEERFEKDRIEKWKSALKRVAALRGLSLNSDRDMPLLVENTIKRTALVAMANTSAGSYSDCNRKFEYQVFLSFRGTDTRTFVDHLFHALQYRTGYRVFLDNIRLEYGKDIQQKLYEGIKRSEVSVVILSPGYANSHWCLDELVEIMERQALNLNRVLPVFFNLEPTVVRNQTGVYKDAFLVLEERFEKDTIDKWKSALKRVADLRGLSLNADRDEPLLVENIIQELRKLVITSRLYVPRNIVGRDSILNEINMWLRDGSTDVEVGVISGLGGIGKSTVAKIAYDRNARLFDGCSFLADFTRKTTQIDGLSCLLEQVIFDVTGKPGNKIHNVDKGLNDVRALLCWKRVLLVLDDVDELKYLPEAFDDPEFYGTGSKIIITTRNEELGKARLSKRLFEVGLLDFQESKQLLNKHAFLKDPHSQRQEELLNEFTKQCQGLPQALFVMGPLLRDKTEEMWENLLKELEEYPDHEVKNVFKLSFECIDDKFTKELFLYIACFFVGMDKEYSLKILDSCKLKLMTGIEKLINRHLLMVGYYGELMMHQSIEEMGKEIARQEAIDEPERRSKLWSSKDSLSVLQNVKGTSMINHTRTAPLSSKP